MGSSPRCNIPKPYEMTVHNGSQCPADVCIATGLWAFPAPERVGVEASTNAICMSFGAPLQGKKARMQREATGNLRSLGKLAAQTIRESKRKLPKALLWTRTN